MNIFLKTLLYRLTTLPGHDQNTISGKTGVFGFWFETHFLSMNGAFVVLGIHTARGPV